MFYGIWTKHCGGIDIFLANSSKLTIDAHKEQHYATIDYDMPTLYFDYPNCQEQQASKIIVEVLQIFLQKLTGDTTDTINRV